MNSNNDMDAQVSAIHRVVSISYPPPPLTYVISMLLSYIELLINICWLIVSHEPRKPLQVFQDREFDHYVINFLLRMLRSTVFDAYYTACVLFLSERDLLSSTIFNKFYEQW